MAGTRREVPLKALVLLVGRKGSIFRSRALLRIAEVRGSTEGRGAEAGIMPSCVSPAPLLGLLACGTETRHRVPKQEGLRTGVLHLLPFSGWLATLAGLHTCWPSCFMASTLAGLLSEVWLLVQGVMPELLPPALCPLLSSAVAPEVTPGAAVVELCQSKMPLPRRTT